MARNNMHMKFEIEIPKQSKLELHSGDKNPIWPPGGHFESDIIENQ